MAKQNCNAYSVTSNFIMWFNLVTESIDKICGFETCLKYALHHQST